MARPNMIVVGAVALGPLLLGLEGYAYYRAHRRPPSSSAEGQPAARPEWTGPPRPAPIAALPAAPAIVPAAAEASIAEPDPAGAAEPSRENGGEPEAALRQQRALAERRGEILRTADEQVFDLLNLDSTKRAAIRAVDEAYVRAVRAMGDPQPNADSQGAEAALNAIQTRHAAIDDILGPDGMQAFSSAERKAERRARSQLRSQSARGL